MDKQLEKPRVVAAPFVDIYEKEDEILLLANMPGVDEKSANVSVENGLLTIEGNINKSVDDDLSPIRLERRADAYRRTFEISDAIDNAKITAKMKHGVLAIKLPRREERKARRIEIDVA